MDAGRLIWEFFVSGGITMIPLAICSILALTIIIYKFFELRSQRFVDEKEIRLIKQMLHRNDHKEALYHCTQNPGVFTNIVSRALEAREAGEKAIREAIEEAGRYEVPKIERYLGILRTVASISPLLGLFGTITGMITLFNDIKQHGLGQAAAFSGGIAEALITTATGLAIAIPTLVMYNIFVDKSEKIILEVEKHSNDVMRQLTNPVVNGESHAV